MARLDKDILDQLTGIFASLSTPVMLLVEGDANSDARKEMEEFISDFVSVSPMLSMKVEDNPTEYGAPTVAIWHDGDYRRVKFCGIPGGHEFTSLIMAVMNACGLGKNLPDETTRRRIAAINGPVEILSFVSLSCAICPDVVQALNMIAILNPGISNTVIDGGAATDFTKSYNVNGVPTIHANGELLSVGQASLGELIGKLEERFGKSDNSGLPDNTPQGFDVVVAGGGPSGVAAAVYLARKAMKVAVIAGRVGGQVKDTTEIENLISVPLTTGTQLATDLRRHLDAYDIPVYDNRQISSVDLKGDIKRFTADTGEVFEAPEAIIATGATWRKLRVPGESDYIGKGVAFCTHCDGPFFAGKRVAVAGGGNSGIEAAIDLAAICEYVEIFEFMDELKADNVLVNKLRTFNNIRVHLGCAITEVIGDGHNVTGIRVKTRETNEETVYKVSGLFVQIGLTPNSEVFAKDVKVNERGEIIADRRGCTDLPGVYAAGDVTDSPYKQIIIAMGSGATAALTAYDDFIRRSAE